MLSILIILSACNSSSKAKVGTGNAVDTSLVFAGISSVDEKTDSTVKLHWTPHPDAVVYDLFRVILGIPVQFTTISGQSSSNHVVTGLSSGSNYIYRVRMRTDASKNDGNTNDISVTLNSAPDAPTALTLITPSSSPGPTNTPTIRLSGVKSGDTIKLFTDACTAQVASGVATGSTIDLTTSSLAAGAYTFYANATNYGASSSACSVATVAYTRSACPTGYVLSGGSCILSFAGATSLSGKTDSTNTLNWAAHADAVAYDVYNTTSGTPSYITTVVGQASAQFTITGLNPSATYKFRVKMRNSSGTSDTNINDLTVAMNAAPDVPSAVALQLPASSPGFSATPTIRVSGVKNGDTVKLYTASNCTTQIASGVATGSTIDLITSSLAAGAYTFYANATNSVPTASACSTASVAYTLDACPSGYVLVAQNTALGTIADFCVAKYEMKNVSDVATSQAAGTPWVSISQTDSQSTCSNLNAINGVANKYYLISNPEWMTIARDLERVDANWSGGNAGVGVLSRGHSDYSPYNALAASTDNDPYSGTGNTSAQAANSGWEQKRTHTLFNGEVIWDLAGNVWEWVDWQVTPANKAYIAATPIAADQGWKEFSALNTKITDADEMKPETWQAFYSSLTGNEGIGLYFAGTNSSGGAALRGGYWGDGSRTGAFTLFLNNYAGSANAAFGFRCVYRP